MVKLNHWKKHNKDQSLEEKHGKAQSLEEKHDKAQSLYLLLLPQDAEQRFLRVAKPEAGNKTPRSKLGSSLPGTKFTALTLKGICSRSLHNA